MSESLTVYNTDKGELKLSPQIVKKYLVNGNGQVTDQEVMTFLALCKYQKLNPFLREAYLIKFGTTPATIVTGKEVFTKRASKLKECAGWEAGIVVVDKNGELKHRDGTLVLKEEELVGGWCKVHRHDWKVPITAEVSLIEYMKTDRDGKPQSSWAKMPATMIRKVAIVQALRDAFPEDFQGMYDSAEMKVDDENLNEKPIEVNYVPVEDVKESKEVEIVEVITPGQVTRLHTISKSNKSLVDSIISTYGYESSKDITVNDYEKICKEIEAEINKAV